MKIAQIAPLIEPIPPKKYGGTERVVYTLTEELVKRGHNVTLFASGDSITSANLVATYPTSLRKAFPEDFVSRAVYSNIHLLTAYSKQEQFDVIHDHTGYFGAPFAQISETPVIMTLHGEIKKTAKDIYGKFRSPFLVTISQAQRSYAPNLNYLDTVYNGLDFSTYPFSKKPGNYLLFVGRICPQKGVHLAIEAARKLNMPLIIAAKYEPSVAKEYFETKVKPFLSKKIIWIGEVQEKLRNKLFSKAIATLLPVTWPEPFGLTLIEAMACGSPVIACNKGSIPEIIKHGKTGFIINSLSEMITAIKNIHKIDRMYCSDYARATFSVERMVDGYEEAYKKAVAVSKLSQQYSSGYSI